MKNRLLCVAMAAFFAVGMISCGNPAEPDDFTLTTENVDNYIVSIGNYEGLTVEASKEELTDDIVDYYANYYYDSIAKETEGMTDENGDPIPMTDAAIKMMNSDVYTTVSEFMVFTRSTVSDYLQYCFENDIVQGAVDQIVASSEFKDIPDALLSKESDIIDEQFTDIAASYELDVDKYLEYLDTSREALSLEYAKEQLVYTKIAKDQGFTETDEDSLNDQVFDYLVSVTNVTEPIGE